MAAWQGGRLVVYFTNRKNAPILFSTRIGTRPSELVAKGEVELGVVVITQALTTPGVELVGPIPPEIQFYTTFTAGVSANSKAPEAARELIKFLTGATAIPVIKTQGMEPAK